MSTSDRELLELAARAAGYDPDWVRCLDDENEWFEILHVWNGDCCMEWNPLTDDGDALRLAVKIRLLVDVCNSYTGVCNEKVDPIEQDHGNDAFAATRRAIVRAAAEIGRSMS